MPDRGKTIVYFDNSNIFHGQRMAGWRIDPKKLHARLERDGPIWQVYFFAAVSDPPGIPKQTSTACVTLPAP
jgi:hypothetical protein